MAPTDTPQEEPEGWWARNLTGTNSLPRLKLRRLRWWTSPRIVTAAVKLKIVPWRLTYDATLTTSGRRYVWHLVAAVAALVLGVAGLVLLDSTTWREVLSGALIAWAISLLFWARGSYRRSRAELRSELNRVTEVDLLHALLNRIDSALGLRPIELDSELQHIIDARTERLAHCSALEEFRSSPHTNEGYRFWDDVAMGTTVPGTPGEGPNS